MKYQPCAGNAPGPFYVVAGGCVGCRDQLDDDARRGALMDLRIFAGQHCRFVVQPATPGELETACEAVRFCIVQAIRYAGDDKTILDQIDRPESCDVMPR
jgi:hypothetical protein